jgi:hypothetical protein
MGIGFARSAIAGFKKHLEGYRSGFIFSAFLISVCSKQDAPQKMSGDDFYAQEIPAGL